MFISIVEAILISLILFGYLWFSIHSPVSLDTNRWVQLFYNATKQSNQVDKQGQLSLKHQKAHPRLRAQNDLEPDCNKDYNDIYTQAKIFAQVSAQTNNNYHIEN